MGGTALTSLEKSKMKDNEGKCNFCGTIFIHKHKAKTKKYCSQKCLFKAYWRRKGRITQGSTPHNEFWIKKRKEKLLK